MPTPFHYSSGAENGKQFAGTDSTNKYTLYCVSISGQRGKRNMEDYNCDIKQKPDWSLYEKSVFID